MSGKRLLIIAIVSALAAVPAFARGNAFRFEAFAGYVNSLESIRADYDGGATQYLAGNFGGMFAGLGFCSQPFGKSPLTLSLGAGAKYASGLLHDRFVRESYVFAPLRFGWRITAFSFGLDQDLVIEPFAGPVFQYGLSSKSNDYNFYHPVGQLEAKRFNTLLGGGVKVVVNSLVLNIGYDFGIIPRYELEGDSYSYRWSCSALHVGVNYRF